MTLIIAEAGINHNGDLKLAKQLVDKAKWAGADAVKFQMISGIRRFQTYWFFRAWWKELKEYCDKKNIMFLCTPHTFNAIHFLDDLVSMFKIASSYLGNINFLLEVASKNKPMLLSTGSLLHDNGMATIEEISNALWRIQRSDITLLHCRSCYPCNVPMYERIDEIKNCGLGFPVGLSDHSKTIKVPKGLPVVEKHIMLEDVDCIDNNVSLIPDEFKEMVEWLKS